MMKRVLSILLAALMVFSILPISALAANVNETADKAQVNSVASINEQNALGFDPAEFAKKQGKSLVKDQIKKIPYVGGIAAGALDSTLNKLFGIEESGGPSVEELIQNVLIQLEAIQLQLDTLTKEFEQESYIRQNFAEFNSSITDVVVAMDSQLYSRLQKYAVDNTGGMTEADAKLDEMRRTLGIALLFSSLPQAGEGAESIAEGSNDTITSLSQLIQTVDKLSRRFCGKDIALIKDNKSLLENAYYISCFDSLLGGEAAMKAGSYNQQVSSILSNAYTVLFTIMEARLSVAKNLSTYTGLSVDSSTELGKLVNELKRVELQFDKDNISNELDSLHKSYAECFYGQDERAKILEPNKFNDNYKSVAESYNDFVQLHWFDYIRDIKIKNEIAQADFVPLNSTLNTIYSSDKDAFGVNWSTTKTSVKGMLEDAVDYTHQKINPVITMDEAEKLLNHIIDNESNLFLPENDGTGIKTFTLFKLLETFGFEVPDAKGLTPYMIHNAESDFKEYYGTESSTPANKYTAHFYVNGLNCSNSIGYSYDQKGTLITEKEGYEETRYYFYRRTYSSNEDKWSSLSDVLYYYFAPAPLDLNTEQDFVDFIRNIANGKNYWGYTVNLNTDVNINVAYSTLWPADKGNKEFRGTFNGNGHTISNLNDTAGNEYSGLFHVLGTGAVVKDLTLNNVNISTTGNAGALASTATDRVTVSNVKVTSGTVKGKYSVGGLIGWLQKGADISGCSNGASVSDGEYCGGIGGCLYNDSDDWQYTMKNCQNSGNISASNSAGGIAGNVDTDADHDFSGCTNTGKITSDGDCAGGIVGRSEGGGNYTNCTNSGAVSSKNCAGGIMGWDENDKLDFSYSENSGTINGTLDAGGIIGKFSGGNPCKFVSCKNSGSVTGSQTAGGIAGCVDNGGSHDFTKCENSGAITETGKSNPYAAGGIVGVNRGACNFSENRNTGTIHAGYSAGGIVGYVDTDQDQNLHGSENYGDVTADLNCAGGMTGQSYGGGDYTNCSNFGNITGKYAGGLLGWNEDDAIDFYCAWNRGDINATNNGGGHGGGVAGYLGNTDHDATYTGMYGGNNGAVTATGCAGGIIGYLYSDASSKNPHNFTFCSNYWTITSNTDCAGGIIGANYGFGDFSSCINNGNINAKNDAGGIIGWNQNDTIELCNCTNSGGIRGGRNSGSLCGYSGGTVVTLVNASVASLREEMKKQKDSPESYKEDKSALLDAYEIVAQNPEMKAEMEADKELQAWIEEMKADVKAEKQSVALDGISVSLLKVNGEEPDWRYVLSANTIDIPEAVKAKLGKDWKVLAAEDISVLMAERLTMEEKPAEGTFTFGFSGEGFAAYKDGKAIVYHVTENGIEELKPVWNEEKQCFEVTADTCSPFVLAAKIEAKEDPGTSPQTGDNSNMALWVILLALSSMGLCACLVHGKKRKNMQ